MASVPRLLPNVNWDWPQPCATLRRISGVDNEWMDGSFSLFVLGIKLGAKKKKKKVGNQWVFIKEKRLFDRK